MGLNGVMFHFNTNLPSTEKVILYFFVLSSEYMKNLNKLTYFLLITSQKKLVSIILVTVWGTNITHK